MFKSIVVGTDGSATAGVAVDRAAALAAMTGARLHIVHAHRPISSAMVGAVEGVAIDVGDANQAIAAEGARICESAAARPRAEGVKVDLHPVAGDPADALVDVARDLGADLIVIGNRGMSSKKRFVLGSVPNKVSHHSPCSLLIVDTTSA